MPGVRAELIGGIVYISSRRTAGHGRCQCKLARLVDEYAQATPGTEGCLDVTNILGADAEPQPDTCLFILPEFGGQVTLNADGYLCEAPEWVGEISDSTESIDLNRKKVDYEKAGVREYLVVAVRAQQVFWFTRSRGKFKRVAPATDGVIRSTVFPGFWLDPQALLELNGKRLLKVLQEGLASREHADFVAALAKRQRT